MTGLEKFGGKLEPTATYCRRWWSYIRTPGLPCDGLLFLGQQKEKGGDIDEQVYGAEEVVSPHGFGWRSFCVRKLGAEAGAEDEQYTTSCGPAGKSVCTCTAGKTRTEICRHRCGLRAACDGGAIPKKRLEGA